VADLEGSESIEIAAPIGRCFAIASNLDRVPEWHGAMKAARVVERYDDGRARLVEGEMDALVASVKVTLEFDYDEPGGVRWTRRSGDLRSLDGWWEFEEVGAGVTRATYGLAIGLNRTLALLRKGVRGPAETKVRRLLASRPVEGLKREAEKA
jgi:Polyketide cyclase / dehydrase and lipid transport